LAHSVGNSGKFFLHAQGIDWLGVAWEFLSTLRFDLLPLIGELMRGISVNLKLYLVSAYLDLKPRLSPKTRLWLLLHLVRSWTRLCFVC